MINIFDLTGKVVVVTGASSGLGADAALCYAEAGASVALLGIETPHRTKEKIEAIGGGAIAIKCDVRDEENVRSTINTVLKEFGHIDILLNNAGIAVSGGIDTMSVEEWNKSFNTNVKGMFLVSKYVVPKMKERGYGKIINISSINAVIADKDATFIRHSYNASKSAILGLTKGMAASYAKYGITVNAIGPAMFKTQMTEKLFKSEQYMTYYNNINPTGRPPKQGELNGTILYLSSNASSYVQGQFIIVDGGASIV